MKQDRLHKIFQSSPNHTEEDIRRYLENELNDDERFKLENQMLDDPLLSEAVEGYSENNFAFTNPSVEKFEDFLERMDVSDGAKIRSIQPQRTRLYRLAVAASVLLLAAFGAYYVFQGNSQLSNDQLFAQNFEVAAMGLPQFRGDSVNGNAPEINPILRKAIQSYEEKDFATSYNEFEKYILNVNADNNFALFHAGISSLKMDNFSSAFEYFMKLSVQKGDYSEEASWYLALTKIKLEDRKGATEILDYLIEKTSNKELLQKAERLKNQL